MTLCIAAACQEHGNPRIVVGTDWKAGIEIAAAENQEKFYWITENMAVMIAGDVARAIELKDAYRQYFQAITEMNPVVRITSLNIGDLVKKPIQSYMFKRADEHVVRKFGLDYNSFLDSVGQSRIPNPTAVGTFGEIARLDFGCELILVTFVEGNAYIYKVTHLVEPCDNFAAIGSGCLIAEGALYQRKHESSAPLGPTVYRVFEAMKLGSVAPTVGTEHTINVLYPPRKDETVQSQMADLKDSTLDFLERKFRDFGPRPFRRMKLPPHPFE